MMAAERPSLGERRRAALVMSWSTTQKAVYNGLGHMPGAGFKTPEDQAQYQTELQQRLAAVERGEPWPQDRWVLDRVPE